MGEAGQDWARSGAVATEDAALTAFASGGAILVWDTTAGRPGFANAAGRALLGCDAAEARLPAQARQRLDALAGGLASTGGIRMERLRLTAGFSALPITCGCKLLALPEGKTVLAIAIPATELRRLGVVVPPAVEAVAPAAQPQQAPEAPAAAAPKPATVRFLWQSDREGRLTSVSENMALLAGTEAPARLVGQRWEDLIGSTILDRDGGLGERFAAGTTWSGHALLWRTDVPDEGAKVELSGMPVLDAQRALAGFRGFGLARLEEREPFPAPEPVAAEPEAGSGSADEYAEIAPAALVEPVSDVPAPAPAPKAEEQEAPQPPAEAAVVAAEDEPLPPEEAPVESPPALAGQDERDEPQAEKIRQTPEAEAKPAANSRNNIVSLRSETAG